MTYKATLKYLYHQLPMFQRIGKTAFKKDLSNIIALMNQLDHPHQKFKSIHIAGTNGKGSTAHLISAILQEHGLKVGLYTSPHYKDFRERIKINGVFIPKKNVVAFVDKNRLRWKQIQPSFFEITVALAFNYFAEEKVDVAIIETGLGGRLDSTNIVKPLLSVITNISFDHQRFLGDTLKSIAKEKAGIIKSNTPVVIGETNPITKPVFDEKANCEQAPITYADQNFKAHLLTSHFEHSIYDVYQGGVIKYRDLKVNLFGNYQQYNLQTALQTIETLSAFFPLRTQKVRSGLANLKSLSSFIGRWQLIGENPTILVDSAHNEKGIQLLKEQLEKITTAKLHVVLGMVNDKDRQKILRAFPKEAKYYFAKAKIPRGLDVQILREEALKVGLKGRAYVSVKNALQAAKRAAKKEDLIFVGGSIFVVAEVL